MAQSNDPNPNICEAIQTGIDMIVSQEVNPSARATPVGLLQSLFDPDNRVQSDLEQLTDERGHRKRVRVRTLKRSTKAQTTTDDSCPAGTEVPVDGQVVDIAQYRNLPITVSRDRIRALCESYSNITGIPGSSNFSATNEDMSIMREVTLEIQASLEGLRLQVENDLLTSLSGSIGDFAVGSPNRGVAFPSFNLLKQSDDEILMNGWNKLRKEYSRLGISSRPIVISGYDVFNDFNQAKEMGCCNLGGLDFSAMAENSPYKYYISPEIDEVFTADQAVMFAPGTVQALTFNRYVGNFAGEFGTMQMGTMQDLNVPGLIWDLRIDPQPCGDPPAYNIYPSLDFDLYVMPTDLFRTGDRLEGTNGVLGFTAARATP